MATQAEKHAKPPEKDDLLVIQFSTAAPIWRGWMPERLRQPSKLYSIVGDKNWASGMIRRSCHSPFSHVDLVMKDGNLLGASDYQDAPVISGNARGVAIRPPDYGPFAYRRQMQIKTPRADDVINVAATQLGKHFDNGSLWDMISDHFPGQRDWRMDDSWFCAELVLWAMEASAVFGGPLRWPKNRVSPTDILMLFLTDARWVNRDQFWHPVPGLKLGPNER
jgi:hypothetical protein